jgi:hypothetical protein
MPSPRTTRARRAALATLGTLLAVPIADAQPAPPGPPSPDPTSIWTIQDENATITTAKLTDRYYVNGLRIGVASGTDFTPDALETMAHTLWGDGQTRVAFDLTQQIFTPADTAAKTPPVLDRPYAGLLLGDFNLITDTQNARSTVGVDLGVVGPWALGEQVQNGFHDLIGQGHNNGWNTQLRNEFAFEVTSARTWRLPLGSLGGLAVDALPELDGGLGNVRIFAESGAVIRIGQGLDSDFGVARVSPGMSGGDPFVPTRPFAWYVFAGGDTQGVIHDITLDGNTFESSRHVVLKPFVGEIELGAAVMAFGTRLTYTHVLQTQEFQHQKGGLHQFGSLALSVRF